MDEEMSSAIVEEEDKLSEEEAKQNEKMIAEEKAKGDDDLKPIVAVTTQTPGTNAVDFEEMVKPVSDEDAQKEFSDIVDSLMHDDTITLQDLKAALGDSDKNSNDANDIVTLLNIVNDHLNGKIEGNNYFKLLPEFYQNAISTKIMSQNVPVNMIKPMRNMAAEELIDNLAQAAITKSSTSDLDTAISQINQASTDLNNELGKLSSKMMIDYSNQMMSQIKLTIEKMIASDNPDQDKIHELEGIYDYMLDEVFQLKSFKEYCKKVKIKHYELEKPAKVFREFNYKYSEHTTRSINNIAFAPSILANHIPDHVYDTGNMKLLIAFCKYSKPMDPSNIKDHMFMYYFIKNLFVLDMVYPKGKVEEISDDKKEQDEYYRNILANLNECIDNLLDRDKNNIIV